ncbi:MAG: hypothetical protein NVSMB27_09890 [Ktedonobacteraceae bacterium]
MLGTFAPILMDGRPPAAGPSKPLIVDGTDALPHQESDFAFFNKHRLWEHRYVFNSLTASAIPLRPQDRKPLIMRLKGQIPGEAI